MIGLRKSKLPMIRVHPSIYFITALIVMLGRGGEFIAVLLFVTLHEAAHWAAGVRFGLTLREVLFTPVGERAVLPGVELLAPGRRAAVYLAGPAVSLLLWAGFSLFMPTETGAFCGKINLAVALLNLLPILPLDGGQLLFILAEGRFGTLKSARAFFAAGRALSAVVILCGLRAGGALPRESQPCHNRAVSYPRRADGVPPDLRRFFQADARPRRGHTARQVAVLRGGHKRIEGHKVALPRLPQYRNVCEGR